MNTLHRGASRPYGRFERSEFFDALVVSEAAGEAAPGELATLAEDKPRWELTLEDLLDETDRHVEAMRRRSVPERDQVLADLLGERERLAGALTRLTGRSPAPLGGQAPEPAAPTGVARLQLCWKPDAIVAWGGDREAPPTSVDDLNALLAQAEAPVEGWSPAPALDVPGRGKAPALSKPIDDVFGWLVAVGAAPADAEVGPSALWLGQVAAWAVELVAAGHFVPQLARLSGTGRARKGASSFGVRWEPALLDGKHLSSLARACPGAARLLDPTSDPEAFTRSAVTGMVDALCRSAAARVEVPASPRQARTAPEVAEAFLGWLDGTSFEAPPTAAAQLTDRLQRWARPITESDAPVLVVALDPPERSGGWHLKVLAPGPDREPQPVEVAIVTASAKRKRRLEEQLHRLERLLPALERPGSHRRGEVMLDGDEAWELMTDTGQLLAAAGFDVRVPAMSRRRSRPALRLTTDATTPSVVGMHQLADVRWSAMFDDVELTAAEIARLAAAATPMVQSRGRWIALDHADLAAAAAALAERAKVTQLSGADVLRHALGLEGTGLEGGIGVVGTGWAADLLGRASAAAGSKPSTPKGFLGSLRDYQLQTLGWLGFLDASELGGIVALDMGLGKTPTVLAHLEATKEGGPALIITPPAVVGNWAAEAARFTPDLQVVVHHGAGRADAGELDALAARADVVLTSYGTAVRDMEALEAIEWGRVVLDEAQAIKNPTSEKAQALRRLPARSRIALTGTPVENGLGDLWAILDFTNPGLVGPRAQFISHLSGSSDKQATGEAALRALNGLLVFRRTKSEPAIAAELPDRIDQLDHCEMTPEQIGLYQAVIDDLVATAEATDRERGQGRVLAAITALKQICNHPAAYTGDPGPLPGRSGKLNRLDELIDGVFAAGERMLVFTHFAEWGKRLADHLTVRTGVPIACYHGGLSRTARDELVRQFQQGEGPGALVLSLTAGGTGLNLTAANHVVLYDRWWNPAVEDQARDRAWRIGQTRTVISHRLVCPGTVDERVEEVVAGKRKVADLVLPKSSSLDDLDADQLRAALGLRPDQLADADSPTQEVVA